MRTNFNIPFRTVFISNPDEYKLPAYLPFELDADNRCDLIIQKRNPEVMRAMISANDAGVDATLSIGEGEFGREVLTGFLDVLRSVVKEKEGTARILDVGCGTGYCVFKLRELGYDIEGIEPGKRLCEIAKERFGIDVFNGYLNQVNFDRPFDLIYMHGALDHVEDPYRLVEDMKRILKPEGKILFAVPNSQVCLELGAPCMMTHQHFSYFTPASAERFLEYAGFEDNGHYISKRYGQYLYFWGTWKGKTKKTQNDFGSKNAKAEIAKYLRKISVISSVLQKKIDQYENPGRAIALYGASAWTWGLLDWKSSLPKVFDTDVRKHGYCLAGNNHPIERPEKLLEGSFEEIWIQAWRYDEAIKKYLMNDIKIPSSAKVISFKDIYGAIEVSHEAVV